MNIAEKFKELFNEELTKESVDRISILPIKKVDGLFRDITNWKANYKINGQLEDRLEVEKESLSQQRKRFKRVDRIYRRSVI